MSGNDERARESVRLQPPRTLIRPLRRSYLFERFMGSLERQLVLLRAPAGYGKTMLMSAAYRSLQRRGDTVVWITPGDGATQEGLMRAIAGRLGNGDVAEAAARLREATVETPIYVFVDEVERLGRAGDPLDWLIEHLSEGVRIAIAGRRFPPLRLSRLRMQGLLAEIGHGELAFGRGEVQQVLGPSLRPEQFEQLTEVLAGWPALTQLTALGLERASGAEQQMLLDGTHPILRDFVLEEVVPALGPTEIAALVASADLQDFTLEIAADLLGMPNTPAAMRLFEDLPPLILADRERVGWFRPHPVVAGAITAAFKEGEAERAERHRRASELLAARGHLEKAVLHASLAGDYDLAVRTIVAAGGAHLFLRAGYTVLQGIIRAIPHEVVLATPSLRLCRGVMLAKSGLIGEARAVIDGLAAETRAGTIVADGAWSAMLEHMSSLIDIYEDRGVDAAGVAALEEKLHTTSQEETWRLGWVHNSLAIAYTRSADLDRANANAVRALACYEEERSSYPQVFMHIHLAFIHLRANRLDVALVHGQRAEALIRGRQWNDINLLAIARVPNAGVAYLQGDIGGARQMLEPGMQIMAKGEGWVDFFAHGYGTLARARLALSGLSPARDALEDGFAVAEARGLPRLRVALSIVDLELLTRAGDFDAAAAVARQLPDPRVADAWSTDRERREAALAIARLSLRQGRTEEAILRLDDLTAECRAGVLLRASLLRVEALWNLGDAEGALAALGEAAELSRSGEQVQQARDEGAPLAEAIRAIVRRKGVSRLSPVTAEFIGRVARVPGTVEAAGLLSPREAEILALLDEGLSNKAIARRLDITEPTVKFHLKNLFGKLGVSRRTLALSVARTSGLLKDRH